MGDDRHNAESSIKQCRSSSVKVHSEAPSKLFHDLTDWAADVSWERLPEAVQHKVKLLLLDFVVSAEDGKRSQIAVASQVAWGRDAPVGPCRSFGLEGGTNAQTAAMLNGVASFAHNFCDTSLRSLFHGEPVIISALFSAAQEQGCRLPDLLTAIVVGYEFAEAAGDFLVGRGGGGDLLQRGFNPTATVALLGAAAGLAKLSGGSPQNMLEVMGLAASYAGGCPSTAPSAPSGFWISGGNAAGSAVLAWKLCEQRPPVRTSVLFGSSGFFAVFGTEQSAQVADLPEGVRVEEYGVSRQYIRYYSAANTIEPAIRAALRLRGETDTELFDEMIVKIPAQHFAITGYRSSDCHLYSDAQGSHRFVLAAAWTYGDVTPKCIYDALANPDVVAIAKRIRIEPDGNRQPEFGRAIAWPAQVSICVQDGRRSTEAALRPVTDGLERSNILGKLDRQGLLTQEVKDWDLRLWAGSATEGWVQSI